MSNVQVLQTQTLQAPQIENDDHPELSENTHRGSPQFDRSFAPVRIEAHAYRAPHLDYGAAELRSVFGFEASQQCALLDASLDASHSHQYQLGAPASGASTRTSLDGHFRQFKVCRITVSHESNSVSKLTQNAAASAA
jgi:hypothetical protein